MKLLSLAVCALGLSIAAHAQTSTVTLTGTATITGVTGATSSTFSLIGSATILGLGSAVFSGAGTVPNGVLTGQINGPVTGNYAMIFPDGAILYGSFAFPTVFLVPQVGGSASVTGSLNVSGGTGRFDGARGVFNPLTGTGTIISSTSSSYTISGNGNLSYGVKILPTLAFGGGWYTALYFTNSTSAPVSFPLSFTSDSGAPLTIADAGGSSTTVNIAPGGSARIEAPNTGNLQQGYAIATLPPGVNGYGVFRQSAGTVADQEAVVQFSNSGVTTSTLIFDETNYITGIAVANPNNFPITVNLSATNQSGNLLGTGIIQLAALSKTSVALKTIAGLTGIVNNRGTVTFSSTSGSFAVLGLRFNGSAFTSIPTSEK